MTHEDNVAERIAWEMHQRGWSQERLAKEMTKVGHPFHQTSISKIVNPADGKRRSISVDDALGFAKVFGVPVTDLLLPLDAVRDDKIRAVVEEIEAVITEREAADKRLAELNARLARLRTTA